jgi:hypothetical protein
MPTTACVEDRSNRMGMPLQNDDVGFVSAISFWGYHAVDKYGLLSAQRRGIVFE